MVLCAAAGRLAAEHAVRQTNQPHIIYVLFSD
jgi:hypothetical protein